MLLRVSVGGREWDNDLVGVNVYVGVPLGVLVFEWDIVNDLVRVELIVGAAEGVPDGEAVKLTDAVTEEGVAENVFDCVGVAVMLEYVLVGDKVGVISWVDVMVLTVAVTVPVSVTELALAEIVRLDSVGVEVWDRVESVEDGVKVSLETVSDAVWETVDRLGVPVIVGENV